MPYVYLVPISLRRCDADAAVSLLCECRGASCISFEPGHGLLCSVLRSLTTDEQSTLSIIAWEDTPRKEEPDDEIGGINDRCICDAQPGEVAELQRRYEHAVRTTPRRMPLGALEHFYYRRLVYHLWDVVDPWYAEALPKSRSAELLEIMSHIRPYRFVRFALDVRNRGKENVMFEH